MKIIVGGVIEKDGKVLLVQEKQDECYGKWNIPAGHLDCNESIIEGARREIKEEVGIDINGKPIKYFHAIELTKVRNAKKVSDILKF